MERLNEEIKNIKTVEGQKLHIESELKTAKEQLQYLNSLNDKINSFTSKTNRINNDLLNKKIDIKKAISEKDNITNQHLENITNLELYKTEIENKLTNYKSHIEEINKNILLNTDKINIINSNLNNNYSNELKSLIQSYKDKLNISNKELQLVNDKIKRLNSKKR